MTFEVRVFEDRAAAGAAGAAVAGELIRATLAKKGRMSVVFASAVSQDPFLSALRSEKDIAWERITAFHMDEYVGMAADHPASFR